MTPRLVWSAALFAIAMGCGLSNGGTGDDGVDAAPSDSSTDSSVSPADGDASPADSAPCGDACAPDGLCVKCPPSGWTLVLHHDRSPTAPIVPCPPGWVRPPSVPSPLFGGLVDPGCSACGCDKPTERICSVSTFECSNADDCSAPFSPSVSSSTSSCATFSGDIILSHCRAVGSGPTGGKCATNGGEKVSVVWSSVHDLCEPAVKIAGCVDSVCVPGGAGYEPNGCVVRAGDVDCPAGFTVKKVRHADSTDTRKCGACTCGAPSGGACGGVTAYACADCVGSSVSLPVSGACTSLGGINCGAGPSVRSASLPVASGGACTPSGGGVDSGSIVPKDPWTLCCP
jgi:hypothetical protein